MAKNSFNFQAKIGLESAGFKRGVREVQGSLNSLRSSFLSVTGALGLGLGLQGLISNLKNTAVELDTAMNTLKNVSKVTETVNISIGETTATVSNFGENLNWLKGVSDKYGQDLVVLTHSFAQFTSACQGTGLELKEQKNIYEQLIRAAAYFHLSADSTKDMMVAVTQMMSKGKVTAEELRRQLGNSLPGAFNIMARACGLSTAELDKMMKEGKIISAEVLPKFANELAKMTQGASFDSLQLSLNRLKNEWYAFTERGNFAETLKKGIEGLTSVVSFLGNNLQHIGRLLLSIGAATVFLKLQKQGEAYVASMVSQINAIESKLASFQNRFKATLSSGTASIGYLGQGGKYSYFAGRYSGNDQKELQRTIQHNKELLKLYNLKKKTQGASIFSPHEVQLLRQATAQLQTLSATTTTATVSVNRLKAGFISFGVAAKAAIKSVMKATLITAIIQLVYEGVMKIVNSFKLARQEASNFKRVIDGVYKTYESNIQSAVDSAEAQTVEAQRYLNILKDVNKSEGARQLALEKLSAILDDVEIKKIDVSNINTASEAYKKLAKRVGDWAEASVLAAQIEIYAQEEARATVEKRKRLQRINEIDTSGLALTDQRLSMVGEAPNGAIQWDYITVDTELGKERKRLEAEIRGYEAVITNASTNLNTLGAQLQTKVKNLGNGGGGGGGGNTVEGIAKIYQDYVQDLKELKNKLNEGAITQEQYNELLTKLQTKTYEAAAATGELSILNVLEKQNNNKALTAMEKWYLNLAEAANESAINVMFAEAEKMFDALQDEIADNLDDIINNNENINKMSEMVKQYSEYLNMIPKTFAQQRSTTFDYGKSQSDILGEQFDIANERARAIEEIISKLKDLQSKGHNVTAELEQWNEQLKTAQLNADSFEEAMNLAKIREDIENLSTNLANSIYGGIQNVVGNIDNIVSSFDRLKSTLEDVDASGWEKFMAVFSTFTSLLDTAVGLYELFNTLTTISNTLKGAEAAEQATINGLKTQELATAQALLAAKGTEIGLSETATVVKGAEAAASTVAATASAGEAVAGATASGAKMPFPLNLLAIGAGVAAVIAALASMSKFANGGIVGGNSTHGDRNIARVNSGEMILNKAQQGTLWSMLNGKGGMGGRVNFKIKGSDLIGVMENEVRKRNG